MTQPNNNTTEQPKATKTPRVVTPKLRCIVTGNERLTNKKYLDTKAAQAGVSVSEYLGNYISREALRLLRQGKPLAEVRTALNSTCTDSISDDALAAAIKMNGKWGKVAA